MEVNRFRQAYMSSSSSIRHAVSRLRQVTAGVCSAAALLCASNPRRRSLLAACDGVTSLVVFSVHCTLLQYDVKSQPP